MLFLNCQLEENGLSPAHQLFSRPIRTNVKPQLKPPTTETVIKLET